MKRSVTVAFSAFFTAALGADPAGAQAPAAPAPPAPAAPAGASTAGDEAAAAPAATPAAPAATAPTAAAALPDHADEATPATVAGQAAAPTAPGAPPVPATPTPKPCPPCPGEDQRPAAELVASPKHRLAATSTLGLAPGAPQVATLPGGMSPSFGAAPTKAGDWRFDFHGFLNVPLRIGVGEREDAGADQKITTLHSPPRVPGELETFEYSSVVPDPWVQLNFSYGNPVVVANVIVAARTVSNANGYFDPSKMLGINDAYLTFKVPAAENVHLNLNVGAFANRYGNMGEYDLGRYGTPLIARVAGTGVTGTSAMDLGDVDLVAEVGFQGQLNKAPVGVEPAAWNGYADPNVGTSFAAHGHVAAGFVDAFQLGAHYVYAFAQDDRATPQNQPDGNISVIGVDSRLTLGRYGHLYAGYAHTGADTARSVSGVLRVLNAPGGPGLMREYFGPDSEGTGRLHTLGAQYDLSLGNLLRYPSRFEGNAPDLVFSLFSIATFVDSPNDVVLEQDPDDQAYDGVTKLKYGGEVGYSINRWFALASRYDRVLPDIDDATETHAIVSGYVIFRSDWAAQDQVTLQYSRYLCGSGATVIDGYPPERDPSIVPDGHVVALNASMWW